MHAAVARGRLPAAGLAQELAAEQVQPDAGAKGSRGVSLAGAPEQAWVFSRQR